MQARRRYASVLNIECSISRSKTKFLMVVQHARQLYWAKPIWRICLIPLLAAILRLDKRSNQAKGGALHIISWRRGDSGDQPREIPMIELDGFADASNMLLHASPSIGQGTPHGDAYC